VFGMMEAMLSFLRRQVGLRTDSADASGSLHAKITALKSYIETNYFRNKSANLYTHSGGFVPENTETTLFSVTGSGIAIFQETCSAYGNNIGSSYPSTQLKIYVDGNLAQTINIGTVGAGQTVTKVGIIPIFRFSSSFSVKGVVGDNPGVGSGSVGVVFGYGLSCFVE